MCGIVGVAGWVAQREKTVFSNLLGWDVVRGPHATGVAAIRKNNDVHIFKRAMHAYDFMDLKGYDAAIDNSKILIGHNRFGTVGSNSHRNAHPFVFDNIVGVHNGTIQYMDRKVLKDHDKFDTDSEAIYYNIGEFGPKEALKDLKGAWSLVWWNRVDHTLNFLRNKERPMYWTLSESKREMYWASESPMLQAVLARHNIKHGPVYGTPENTMLTFTIPDNNSVIEAPQRAEVKGADPFVFQGSQRHLGLYGSDHWDWEGQRYQHRDGAPYASGTEDRKYLPGLRSTEQGSLSQSTPSAAKPSEKPNVGVSLVGNSQTTPGCSPHTEIMEAVKARMEQDESDLPFTPDPVSGTPNSVVPFTGANSRLVPVHNDLFVGKEEFDKRAKDGCAYCEKTVTFADVAQHKEAAHWLRKDAFLCDECMDDTDILEYLVNQSIEIPQRKKLN